MLSKQFFDMNRRNEAIDRLAHFTDEDRPSQSDILLMLRLLERNYPPPFSAHRSGARLLISAPPCQGVQSLNPCLHGTD